MAEQTTEKVKATTKAGATILSIVIAVLFMALGIFMLLNPELLVTVLYIAIGTVLLVMGAVNVIRFAFAKEKKAAEFSMLVNGVVSIVLGILFLFRIEVLKDLVSIFVGILIIISSLSSLVEAFAFRKISRANVVFPVLLAVVGIVCGVLCLIGKIIVPNVIMQYMGIMLIVYGVVSLLGTFILIFGKMDFNKNGPKKKKEKKEEKKEEKTPTETGDKKTERKEEKPETAPKGGEGSDKTE